MSSGPRSSERRDGAAGPAPPFERVGLLGLGVMGGSFGRALATCWPTIRRIGWSPDASERQDAHTGGAIDEAAPAPADAVAGADLVVLAVPLDAALELVGVLAPLTGGATLMDVASLKTPLAEAARRAGVADRWVGAHPMAGSEASGFRASRPDLYREARVWLCAGDDAKTGRGEGVERLWTGLGARPAWIDAREHDEWMGLVSHLPQLTSNALAVELAARGVDPESLGPGGRDATRLAGSNPEVWRAVFMRAPRVLAAALRGLGARLTDAADALDAGDLAEIEALMASSRVWRSGEDAHP